MKPLPAALAVTPTDPTNVDAAELSAEKLTVRFQGLAAISDVSLSATGEAHDLQWVKAPPR